jgi:prefoldin subunit 5
MSDALSLELIGRLLRQIQAEQRTLRGEITMIRADMAHMRAEMITKREVLEAVTVIVDRIGNFEALMETRMDQLAAKLER